MTIPVWVTLAVAALVMGFGSYRIWLSIRSEPPTPEGTTPEKPSRPTRSLFAGGFYRMGKRTHLFVGIIYILLGCALVATTFGWNPLGDTFGSQSEQKK